MARKKAAADNQMRRRVGHGAGPNKNIVSAMHTEARTQMLVLLNERTASKPEIAQELGLPPDKVRYELDVLKSMDPPLVELVYEKPVRGTVEKFYRATMGAYLSRTDWLGVPDNVKQGIRGSLLNVLVEDAVAAVKEDAFDSLPGAHLSWNPMILDDQGWEDIVAILCRAMEETVKVKEESAVRLASRDERGKSCTVSMLGYASANEDRKVAPSSASEGSGKASKGQKGRKGRKKGARDRREKRR